MNNKTYANYLMHGRTKGSKNGISTTKGYTAVGQKAKGKYVNGRWVYDDYSYHPSRNMWQQQAAATASKGTIPQNYTTKQYIHNENKNLNNKWNSQRAGAQNNWQQQAASQQYKDQQKRSAYADTLAKGAAMGDAAKAAEARNQSLARANAKNLAARGASNNWQQQANAKRDDVETYRRYKNNAIGGIAVKDKTGDVDVMYHPEAGYTAIKTIKEGAATKGSKNNWQQQANKAASRPTAGKQTNIGASQSADLARWAQQNRNNIAASKKAAAKQELIKKADASYDAYQKSVAGAKNNWQNRAAKESSFGRAMNKYNSDQSKDLPNFGNKYAPEREVKANPGSHEYWTQEQARLNRVSRDQERNSYSVTTETKPYISKAAVDAAKLAKQGTTSFYTAPVTQHDLWEAKKRNSRSDIGNAIADAKEDAKNAFKALKKKLKKKK